MCGIAGILNDRKSVEGELSYKVSLMTATLIHRGPDDTGIWVDSECGLALGHRRLSIIDLSQEGHQPMISASGRYVIIFNGEIYNFLELRQELKQRGHKFRGNSDTEVMLAAFEEFGVRKAVQQFNGMFAFALWDCREKLLHLSRDRMGKKPLYYGWAGRELIFASELKAFWAHPDFKREIDRGGLALLMRYICIPAPHSIYKNVWKVLPSSILTLSFEGIEKEYPSLPKPISYWSVKEVAEKGATNRFKQPEKEILDDFESLLRDATGKRMISDVPLGAFLSGGIDSSLIVSLMQIQSSRPVKTFTIGFHEKSYDEAQEAKAIARHLGTNHTELYVTPEDGLRVIPQLPEMFDEPFADSSQIPTYLVSKLARENVTVALSGDGGDELFGGYLYHQWQPFIWDKIKWLPTFLRKRIASLLLSVPVESWNKIIDYLSLIIPSKLKQRNFGDKVHLVAGVMDSQNPEDMYHGLVSLWKDTSRLVIDSSEPPTYFSDPSKWPNLNNFTEKMMCVDAVTYLPDDVLIKVDRASMRVSLEIRNPLLDYRVVEFTRKLPTSFITRNNQGKWILRQILHRYVPRELFERPKTGFGVPVDAWIRGPLRDWAESLLNEKRLIKEGYLNPNVVRKIWSEHQSGKKNWKAQLWSILMFQAWLEQQ